MSDNNQPTILPPLLPGYRTSGRLMARCSSRMPRDAAKVSMVAARMGWEASRLADLLGVTLDLERRAGAERQATCFPSSEL
jgi:hypothetical protein